MEPTQLQDDFHRLIDKFSDIRMLKQFYEVLSDYQNQKTGLDILDELTQDQQTRLKASVKQAQTGETLLHDDEVKGKVNIFDNRQDLKKSIF